MRFLVIIFLSLFLFANNIKWIKTSNGCLLAYPISLLTKPVKIEYNGECINNKVNGKTLTVYLSDGKVAKFIGDIDSGYFKGLGKLKYEDGSFIAGFWEKSYPKGTFNIKIENEGYYQCTYEGSLHCEGAAARFGKSREAAVARWVGGYLKETAKNTVEMFKSSFKKSSSTDGNIKIEYDGYTDWNKHYTYNIYVNGKLDGQIFYYWKSSANDYKFMTSGTSHDVNGYYAPNLTFDNLYTPQCGTTTVGSIEEAIKKAVNCAYKGHY